MQICIGLYKFCDLGTQSQIWFSLPYWEKSLLITLHWTVVSRHPRSTAINKVQRHSLALIYSLIGLIQFDIPQKNICCL